MTFLSLTVGKISFGAPYFRFRSYSVNGIRLQRTVSFSGKMTKCTNPQLLKIENILILKAGAHLRFLSHTGVTGN